MFIGYRGAKPVLAVVDADSDQFIATPDMGRANDGVIYGAATRRIYTSNGADANLVSRSMRIRATWSRRRQLVRTRAPSCSSEDQEALPRDSGGHG